VAPDRRGARGAIAHRANILRVMKYAMSVALACVAACQTRGAPPETRATDSLDFARLVPRDSSGSVHATPRVVTEPSVVLFWLRAADTMSQGDQVETFDDLKHYTAQVASALDAGGIRLVATNADTVYVVLPHKRPRAIVLSGLDYPFGYLLVDPGGPERILTGVYSDDELMDELRVYFDLPDDTVSVQPRTTT